MLGTLRAKGGLRRARKTWEATAGQFCALVFAAIVAALVQVPFAADQIAEADTPPAPSEVLQARTISSRTHDNHDGTYTTSLYPGPVHYRDVQGQWRPISSAVVPSTESDEYAFENEANRFRTFFKSTSANDFLALQTGGGRFRVTLQNAAQVAAQTGPRKVTYPGVFSGVDLRYELRPDGVKETLLLQNAQAPTSYRFLLTPPANARIHATQSRDGSWAFFMAPHARPVFVIDAPWAAEDDEPDSRRRNASLAVTRVGDVFALDLSVDAAWLRAAGRQFPVRLDPTITIQPTIQDASFNFACGGCSGVASDRLSIGTGSTGLATNTWRSALQFSLADIPPGATISNAKLKLYFDGACVSAPGPACGGTAHQIDALRMTSSWAPSSKTSELAFNTTPLASFTLPASAPAQWMNWDITGTVQDWASGGMPSNFGLLLKRATESANASGPKPPSRNYAAEPTLGPTLQVTYNGDGGELLEPETVHSNGAELRWIPYGGPGAPPFSSYEVHRSTNPGFTPSDSTRLTKILDSAVTSYRDTTAKAGATFTYKIVVNGWETNSRTVTMAAAGEARKLLRPDPAAGRGTYSTFRSDYTECANRGESERLKVGTDTSSIFRTLLRFDLGQMPTDTTVSQATLSLWHPETSGATALTIRAHRLTGHWLEGTGKAECTGDGVTWYETTGGVDWLQAGGDFDPAFVGTISVPASQSAGWNTLNIASLAQQWARGEKPNHGLVFKLDGETIVAGKYLDYYADDFAVAPTLRPKLSLTYTETTSASVSPRVNVSKPRPGELVNGTAVEFAAAAWDDRRVESVQFFVDGNSVGTDSTEPFSVTWNSTTVANGAHNLTAKATDDAGNQTTSSAITVTVGNSAPPTTSITSPVPPPNPPVVSGTVNVSANANDDGGVTKVELYANGLLVATDSTPPGWTFSWNTLDPALPAYDGAHTLTTRAYDAHAQVTTSAAVPVTVANAAGTKYLADLSADRIPGRVETGEQYPVTVTVTNRSSVIWAPGEVEVGYRWLETDGTSAHSDSFSLGLEPILPNGTKIIEMTLEPPSLPAGIARASYQLQVDLFEPGTSTWFATRGDKPLEEGVVVGERNQEPALGVEPYYQYDTEQLGVGMQHLVNVATGNSIVRWTPLQAPGRGLSTVVDLTYNASEKNCNHNFCPAGEGWSLSVSGLTRFGKHTFKPHGNRVELIDADGTLLTFDDDGDGGWSPPDGTHLYLREVEDYPGEPEADWAITSPDRTTYFFDEVEDDDDDADADTHGFPLSVRDKNGNRIEFVRGQPPHHDKHVVEVKDAGQRSFLLAYYEKGTHNGRLQSITDHSGHKLLFSYSEDEPQQGHLIAITEVGGTNADGTPLPDRRVEFQYEPDDPHGKLLHVRDPLGSADPNRPATNLAYDGQGRLVSRTNREGEETSFDYEPGANTKVTKPLNRITRYHHLTSARDRFSVDSVTRYRGFVSGSETEPETTQTIWTPATPPETCTLELSPARHVWKVIEPNGAYIERCYNQNGLVTDEWDQLRNWTLSEYKNSCVDDSTADTNRSISDLVSRKTPTGATWTYEYWTVPSVCTPPTMPNGNLHKIKDPTPDHWETAYDYYQAQNWNLFEVTDANGNATTYEDYDANGFPTKVTDAEAQVTRYSYDADGLLRTMQDPLHDGPQPSSDERNYKIVFDYDSFHRLGRQSSPKSTRFEYGTLIWTETAYDANDNVIKAIQPYYGSSARLETRAEYDAMDRRLCVVEPQANEITKLEYDAAGRLTRVTAPNGVTPPPPPEICPQSPQGNDHVTESSYDALDRVVTETGYDGNGQPLRKTHYCYQHDTGDLLWVTPPKANPEQPPDCNVTPPPPPSSTPYTTRYAYDDAHRLVSETDPLGQSATTEYDEDGNIIREDDEQQTRTMYEYSERGELVRLEATFKKDEQHNPTRILTRAFAYDKAGNMIREVSPRAWDACPAPPPPDTGCDPGPTGDYVTGYRYDKVDRLTSIDLPTRGIQQRTYIHRAYDANGNLTMTSLPVESASPQTPIPADKRTNFEYFDSGWIQTSDDHTLKGVRYDYTAEGWQAHRSSSRPPQGNEMSWSYYPDGLLARAVDRQQHAAEYTYDRNDNLSLAIEGRSQGRRRLTLHVESEYNGYDEPIETRIKEAADANWRSTKYGYDRNGNVETREDDGVETDLGLVLAAGRIHNFSYNELDELTEHLDLGVGGSVDEGDRQLLRTYLPTGLPKDETLSRRTNVATWEPRRTTDWTYFDSGDLRTLTTRSGNATAPVVEQHTLEYEECPVAEPCSDDEKVYVNGNRTRDDFRLVGPTEAPSTDCENACTTRYTYGVRENLVEEKRIRGTGTGWACYRLDAAMNVTDEWDQPDCVWTGSYLRHYVYPLGNRLGEMTEYVNQVQRKHKYFYDGDGNLDCVTTAAWTESTCPAAAGQGASIDQRLEQDLSWHYSGRISSYRHFQNGSEDEWATYDHDPIDRLYQETEFHIAPPSRTTSYSYRGASDLVSSEATGGLEKTFTYGLQGSLLALDIGPTGSPASVRWGHSVNVHGDVSMALNLGEGSVGVEASYGYKPYGGEDPQLTKGDVAGLDQVNPYRFNSKRYDPGSKTLDMGARRFIGDSGPGDFGRFVQHDSYLSASEDLSLASNPLMQNTYAFAAGNPIGLEELDGHSVGSVGNDDEIDLHGTSPKYKFFRVPNLPFHGAVWGGHFIARETVGVPGPLPDLAGDDRGFTPFASPGKFRAYYRMNYRKGRGYVRINPTCTAHYGRCNSPHKISDFPGKVESILRKHPYGWPYAALHRRNYVETRIEDRSTFKVRADLSNSIHRGGPAIDASFSIRNRATLYQYDRFSVSINMDKFPSFELYQRTSRGDLRTLCRFRERNPTDIVPGHKTKSCDWP